MVNLNTIERINTALDRKPHVRLAHGVTDRDKQVMTWRLPNGSSVQMYINPQNFTVDESKQINFTRTKGGFVVQYWGDNLTDITIEGTTGSSGIRGIEVLRQVYHSENRAFDLVAATQQSDLASNLSGGLNADNAAGSIFAELARANRNSNFLLRPSLASLATSVMLFYQGVQYKGFFETFRVVESTAELGLFNYTIKFKATEIRGTRENFMPWHKEPIADSSGAALLSGTLNAVGNKIRGWAGLPQQAETPRHFHPESAPLTFGGSDFGVDPTSSILNMF